MKPLLLIDVDGVLNPYAPILPKGYDSHLIVPPPQNGYPRNVHQPVWLSKEHGRRLNELSDVYDLVWATAWEDDANKNIGPRIGLPELPWITFWDWSLHYDYKGLGLYFKTPHILDYVGDRPFAWIDDGHSIKDEDFFLDNREGEDPEDPMFLLHKIDSQIGLKPRDFDDLAMWGEAVVRTTVNETYFFPAQRGKLLSDIKREQLDQDKAELDQNKAEYYKGVDWSGMDWKQNRQITGTGVTLYKGEYPNTTVTYPDDIDLDPSDPEMIDAVLDDIDAAEVDEYGIYEGLWMSD